MLLRLLILSTILLSGLVAPASASQGELVHALKAMPIWQDYKARFLLADGRVVDNVNGSISHSEGQGYGMVLALAAGDRAAFAKIYSFASRQLAVRDDRLFAWRYDPAATPKVNDTNNASDGDLLIAWALLEAADAGWGRAYERDGRGILADLKPLIVRTDSFGTLLLPGEVGFVNEDGHITVNPAYWIYPALERISMLTGDAEWLQLARSGKRLKALLAEPFGGLVPDWVMIDPEAGTAGLAPSMSTSFGYEAIRVPLYTLWSVAAPPSLGAAMVVRAQDDQSGRMRLVDLSTGSVSDGFVDPGYSAITHLARCAVAGHKIPGSARTQIDGNYYPATLQMLALLATKQRYPQCML